MRALDTPHSLPVKRSAVRWKRVVVAAICSEIGVMLVMTVAIVAANQNALYYLAAPAAALSTFLCAWYAVRRLNSSVVLNGALVGIVATVLTLGFLAVAKPEERLMYGVSYLARIVAGYVAGLAAQKTNR